MRIWFFIFVLFCVGCAKPENVKASSDAWQLDEHTTPADDPNTQSETPKPVQEDDFRSTYEPGSFSWAREGYRVVFHHAAESDENKKKPAFQPFLESKVNILYVTEEGGIHHRLMFPSADLQLPKGARVFPEDIDVGDQTVSQWPNYRGVYFPEPLKESGEPTLHLFEQGAFGEPMIYTLENKLVVLNTGMLMNIHVPRNVWGADWLKCQTKNDYRSSVDASPEEPCGDFIEGRTPYGVVAFFKEDPIDKIRSYGHTIDAYASMHYWQVPIGEREGQPYFDDDDDFGKPVPLLVKLDDYERY